MLAASTRQLAIFYQVLLIRVYTISGKTSNLCGLILLKFYRGGENMKVSEMIEWLKTQDQDAEVEVPLIEDDSFIRWTFFDSSRAEYVDMRGNPFAAGESYEDSRTLYIGGFQ